MNFLPLIILTLGIIIIIVNYILFNKRASCQESRIVYNFVPRTEAESVDSGVPKENIQDLFTQMFDRASPWVERINNRRSGLNDENINLYYISQS